MKRTVVVSTLVLAFGVIPAGVMAQTPAPPPPMPMMEGGPMMEECKAMMAKHEAMKTEMAAKDAKLDALLVAMNAAKGNKKMDATAAVVSELVAQREAMRDHMMAMGPQMMQHMLHHAHMGLMEGMMKSKSACPMMQAAKPQGDEPPKHH